MVKERIFKATVDLVDSYGKDVSVRQIAKAADVNVAAISYHFGNKDNLMNEVVIYKLNRFKKAFDHCTITEIEPLLRIEMFLCELIEIIKSNPEVASNIMVQERLFKTRYEYQQYIDKIGYCHLLNLITEITGVTDPIELTIITEQMLGSCVANYINEINLSNDNNSFNDDIDYQLRVKIFIKYYFHKFIEEKE